MTSATSDVQPAQGTRTVHIPEIAGSLKTLFILRTVVVGLLVAAGIACLYFGAGMLAESLKASQTQTVLLEIDGKFKLTAGGFGAVVMAASIFPFFFAYRSRPQICLVPTGNGSFQIMDESNRSKLFGVFQRRTHNRNESTDANAASVRRLTWALG